MIWKGKQLVTTQDLMKYGIEACDTKEEARKFIKEYVVHTHHARANIGYLAGYYSREKQLEIFDWFDVVHPIFGTEQMAPEDLMKMGMAIGTQAAMRERPEPPLHTNLKERTNEEDEEDADRSDSGS